MLVAPAQDYTELYDDTMVNSIFITMDPDSLNEMYDNLENVHEYAVQFVYQSPSITDTLNEVGFRLHGNTSLFSAKKSFKVSFNTYNKGRTFEGVQKLNLIGEHNDPTMSREKIYFDIYNQFGLPPRRVSFVRVYINGDYYGLYSNIEEYDEIFLKEHFGESAGNLYKCYWGSTLEYNGTNPSAYDTYELQTNKEENDISDLINFTDILNNTPIDDLPCALEKIFDVDDFLKIYAIDIATGHWDNYGANENNYFLYHDSYTGRFHFLSYDCDNTVGVDWLGIDWSDRDIYDWNFDNRPLVQRIMQIPEYRDRFSYYMDSLINTVLLPENIDPHIDSIRELIAPAAAEDEYRTYDYGYSYDDFYNGFTQNGIDGHCPYGIENFIQLRYDNTESQIELNQIGPVIGEYDHVNLLPQPGESVQFTVHVSDDIAVNSVTFFYSDDAVSFASVNMFDDGAHNDALSGDGIYGATVTTMPTDHELFYYFEATDNSGNNARYPLCDQLRVPVGFTPPSLVINEFMAINDATIADDAGEFDDYIELYNNGNTPVYLGDKYLSDVLSNPYKWKMPDKTLGPDTYMIIWADDEESEGTDHCNFKLDGDHDNIGIFSGSENYFAPIDTITFDAQTADVSTGRLPNGTGNFTVLPYPSPGANNEADSSVIPTESNPFIILGNPSDGISIFELVISRIEDIRLDVYSLDGKLLAPIENHILGPGTYKYVIDTRLVANGMYIVRLERSGSVLLYKFAVI